MLLNAELLHELVELRGCLASPVACTFAEVNLYGGVTQHEKPLGVC